MQRIIEKTLKRNISGDELYLKMYYSRCRVFAISGYKDENDLGHNVYELFDSSSINFIPASIACVNKQDLGLCLFATDIYYRRQGYGKELMDALKNIYKGEKLHLYVRVSNKTAIEFYKSLGWIETEIVPNFYWDTLNDEDAIKMELHN